MLGTCTTWWAHCPHIPGTCKSCPGNVPHARDSAHPSHASRTHWGHVPHAEDMCWMVGTLPPHPGNMEKPSQACGTCLGWHTSRLCAQEVFCTCTCMTCLGCVACAQ